MPQIKIILASDMQKCPVSSVYLFFNFSGMSSQWVLHPPEVYLTPKFISQAFEIPLCLPVSHHLTAVRGMKRFRVKSVVAFIGFFSRGVVDLYVVDWRETILS